MIKILLFTLLFNVASVWVYAQKIENVQATQVGSSLVITYDLRECNVGQSFDVQAFIVASGKSTMLKSVKGHVGKGVSPGTGKRIVWDVFAEHATLEGTFLFKVEADVQEDGIPIPMVAVEGGTFSMGSALEQDETQHQVSVGAFSIGKYEITQAIWEGVMGGLPSHFKGCPTCPVENISWQEVQEFIARLNQMTGDVYRLPTEAEWEYAARGGRASKGFPYSGSSNIEDVAWYLGNANAGTKPVGLKKPNELGIYDMSGNVWEWCQDIYGASYYQRSEPNNPKGATAGTARVCRGGAWDFLENDCRVAFRDYIEPQEKFFNIGFRLVKN